MTKVLGPTELVSRLLNEPANGAVQNDLLEAVQRSADVSVLEPLLRPLAAEELLRAGLFVLSELGGRAANGIDLVRPLFSHPSARVRARICEILQSTASDDQRDLDFLISCMGTPELFLARAACAGILRFDGPRILASVHGRLRQVILQDKEPVSVQEHLQKSLGLLLQNREEEAKLVGGDDVGGWLHGRWLLRSRGRS